MSVSLIAELRGRDRTPRGLPALVGLATFMLLCAGICIVDWLEAERRRAEQDASIQNELVHLANEVVRDLDVALGELRSLAAWVALEPERADQVFTLQSQRVLRQYHSLRSTTLLKGDVISNAYPPNPALLGFNVGAHPLQGQAVRSMKQSREALVTGPVQLTQGGVGLILRAPVWQRRQRALPSYWGHVSFVLDASRLERSLRALSDNADLRVRLTDADARGVTGTLDMGDQGLPSEAASLTFDVPGERWTLAAVSRKAAGTFPTKSLGFFMGVFIAVGGGFLAYLVMLTSRRLQLQNRALEKLATTDVLTSVANRRQILDLCRDELGRVDRMAPAFSLLMLDIDHFKSINDEHGHATGDAVLVAVARTVADNVRSIDRVGRIGGEEFLVLLPQTSSSQAIELCERLRLRLEHTQMATPTGPIQATASFGVAEWARGDSLESLIDRADRCLYQAKTEGRNRSVAALGADARGGQHAQPFRTV